MIATLFPLLAGLDTAALAALGLDQPALRLAAGDRLFRQGDAPTGLYLIESGDLRLTGRTPGDGMVELARLGPGDMAGAFSLLDPAPRSATATAIGPLAVRRIAREHFGALAASGDPAALAVTDRLRREVAERTRATVGDIAMALARGAGTARALGAAPMPEPVAARDLSGLLRSFPGFDQLRAEEWSQLEDMARIVHAPRGTLLCPAGQSAGHMLIVARGAIRVGIAHAAGGIAHAIGGIEQLLLHGPGSVSGVAAMLDDRRSELIRDVREDAVLLLLGRSAFDALRGGATPIGRKLFAAIDAQLVRDLRRLSRLLGRLHGEQG